MRPKLEDRPSSTERADRPTRVPIHGRRSVLEVKGQEPGYHYFWANDIVNNAEGNLDRYLDAGYEFVTHQCIVGDRKVDAATSIGGKISKAVGNGVTAFLMRCPDEIYHEELAFMTHAADEVTAGIKASLNSKEEGKYGEVKISNREVV